MPKPKLLLTPKRISELQGVSLETVEAAIRKRPVIQPASRADSLPVFSADDVERIQERICGGEVKQTPKREYDPLAVNPSRTAEEIERDGHNAEPGKLSQEAGR